MKTFKCLKSTSGREELPQAVELVASLEALKISRSSLFGHRSGHLTTFSIG